MLINGKLSTVTLHLMPNTVIERGEHWTIATNLNQNLIGRLIVVAARDVDSVTALSADEWQDLHRHIGRTRVALAALFQPEQYNYAFLMNQDTQVHLHVVPRYIGPRQWAGETYDDPHFGSTFGTEQRTLGTQCLANLADHVRQHLP
jgi:diadenosine tetraphosphate (Ap4A) HIT family hydrolase